MFPRVLFPTDFSPHAERLVGFLDELKLAGTEEVVLLHVVEPAQAIGWASVDESRLLERKLEADRRLASIRSRLEALGLRDRTRIEMGIPFQEIVRVAEEEEVSLIVMGTHGHGFVRGIVLGSVTDNVVRHAPVPVLVQKLKLIEQPGKEECNFVCQRTFHRVLLPTDFSACAGKALPLVKELRAAGTEEVIVLHVKTCATSGLTSNTNWRSSTASIAAYVLILVGNGAVAVAVFTGALDLTGVALLWGLGVALAVYIAAPASGAHLNPAVTLAFAAFRSFPPRKILSYVLFQVAGAFLAALTLYFCWHGFWERTAARLGVVVGEPGSQKLLMVLACFYPNPGIVGTGPEELQTVSTATAFVVEAILTMFLLLAIFALTDQRNVSAPRSNLAPLLIGLAVTAIVGIGAPLTMDAVNPARDFGPRLLGYLLGYDAIAFPGPRGHEWWLYIVAPVVGGLGGGLVYNALGPGNNNKT